MNQTHIHLLITHLPIFGSILGAIVLAQGIWTKTEQTKVAAYYLFILAAIGAGIAYLTGESAAETVEKIQGVLEASIEEHEEFALFALISLIVLGVSAIGGLFLTFTKSSLSGIAASVILVISLVSFGLVARTGYLGGQIRHTEVANGATTPAENSEKEADEH
jgi:uncharacterized membrane protein